MEQINEPLDALTVSEYEHACRTIGPVTDATIEAAKHATRLERRREIIRAKLRDDELAADLLTLLEICERNGGAWLVRAAQRFAETEGK